VIARVGTRKWLDDEAPVFAARALHSVRFEVAVSIHRAALSPTHHAPTHARTHARPPRVLPQCTEE
jgi:hypothetical protein